MNLSKIALINHGPSFRNKKTMDLVIFPIWMQIASTMSATQNQIIQATFQCQSASFLKSSRHQMQLSKQIKKLYLIELKMPNKTNKT